MDSAHVGALWQRHRDPSTDQAQRKSSISTLTTSALRSTLNSSSRTSITSYQTAASYSATTVSSYHTAYQLGASSTPSVIHCPDTNGFQLDEDDNIIAVIGPTGSGKSTFVKIATGSDDIQIGNSLRSCTQRILVPCHDPLRDRRIVFVDTPGFDNDTRSETEILAELAHWLAERYKAGVRLSGILYLHRITDNRMTDTLTRNLDMFQKLCGQNALSNVRLVTTHWDQLKDKNEGIKNEEELRKKYWNAFLSEGSQMFRFKSSYTSAWRIIDSLPMERKAMQIQKEMVNQRKSFGKTLAARSLFSWVHRATEDFKHHTHKFEELIHKITRTDSSENKKRWTVAEKKRREEELKAARKLLNKLENDKAEFYNRPSSVHSSRSLSPSSTSSWRYVVNRIWERRVQQRSGHSPTLSLRSEIESAATDFSEGDPPDPGSTMKSLSCTIQRLQSVRATASPGVIPDFEDAVEITLRISKALNEMSDAYHPLSSLMESVSRLLCTINHKYLPTRGLPSSVADSFEKIHRQLGYIQGIVIRLKGSQVEPQTSLSLSPDDQRAIVECRVVVTSALRELKVANLTLGKSITTNRRGFEDLPNSLGSAENLPKIIAVMGSTGAGKSTFIKAATRTDDGKLPSLMNNVVLVETPGLDDALEGDVQILKGIEKWLKDTYPSGVRLFGILFLHNIMDQRVTTNTMLLNFDLFQNLCNSSVLPSIILVTTNWDQFNTKNGFEGDAHEQQLRNKYWRPLLNNGSKMLRFENTCTSAWNIIKSFPNNAEVKGKGKKKII